MAGAGEGGGESHSEKYFNIQQKKNKFQNLVISGAKMCEVSNPGD